MPAPFREIIHAQHSDLPDLGIGQRPHQLDQRVPADIYSQQRQQPGGGPAGQGSAISSSSRRSSIVRRACRWVSPGTGSANVRTRHAGFWQARRRTVSAIRTRRPRCGQIMQKPAVVAVDPGGGHAASPARRRSARRMRRHQHVIPVIGHLIDGQFRQVGEEHLQAAGIARHDMLDTGHNEPHGRSGNDQVLGRTRSSRAAVLYARTVTRLRLIPDELLDTVSNGTTQKSPEPALWRRFFDVTWRSTDVPAVAGGKGGPPTGDARRRWIPAGAERGLRFAWLRSAESA